jgi:DNA mismatch repair protein MutL
MASGKDTSSSDNVTGESLKPQARAPSSIARLEEHVVNRIAAGEVVQRPCSALKELLENSLDAGSRRISVVTKGGGLQLLQIQDDGHGIKLEDMDIVCERFTTSKLQQYEDLSKIQTFGFRGEALASISHVAHLSITTKTDASPVAYVARYIDSKLAPDKPGAPSAPRPCAGVRGTTITVEELFYNVPNRRKAFKSPAEEYSKILEVVERYATHYSGVSFSVKKHGEAIADLHTPPDASRAEVIRTIFGSAVAKELLPLQNVRVEECGVTLTGCMTNANYQSKRLVFILFINGRLVEHSNLKRVVDAAYASCLPRGTHPWVYLSLSMPGENVDVNVHPTKKEVRFMYEEAVAAAVQAAMEQALSSANASRPFMVQTLLPSAAVPDAVAGARERSGAGGGGGAAGTKSGGSGSGSGTMKNTAGYPKDTVRADHTLQQGQLEAFFTGSARDAFGTADSTRSRGGGGGGDAAQAGGQGQGGWTRGQASTAAGCTQRCSLPPSLTSLSILTLHQAAAAAARAAPPTSPACSTCAPLCRRARTRRFLPS